MALTREQLNEFWPELWIGDKKAKGIDVSDVKEEILPDELLKETPEEVVNMLGFDPLELED